MEKGKLLKKIAFIMMIVLFSSSFPALVPTARSSEAPAVEWSKRYGSTSGRSLWGNSMVQTSDGGFALASTSDFGTGNDANERLWLVKTDSAGNAEWNRTYGEQREILSAIVQTADGGYALACNDVIGGYGIARLFKTDSSGITQWEKSYAEIGAQATAYNLVRTSDEGYVIAGMKEGYDGWLMKTDANGTMLWSRSFAEVNITQLQSVVQTNDGGYVAVGATSSGKGNAYIVKTDSDGNITWSEEFSETAGNDYGRSIIQTTDGGYAMAGDTDFAGTGDFWLMKLDALGNLLWDRTYGGTNWDMAGSIVQARDGGYVLAGQTYSFGVGGCDFWVVKTDSDGNMQWNQTYGGAGDDNIDVVGNHLVQTVDGGHALYGYTNSFSGDGSYEVWLIKLRGPKTWIVDDDGPADFHTIQEAINAASSGDTIFVRNGTYYEHVVVNKTLALFGESRNATIIDGEYKDPPEMRGSVVLVEADGVNVSGFTIQHCRAGGNAICMDDYVNMTFSDNIITGCNEGVRILHSSGNIISYNIVQDCYYNTGIGFDWAYNNVVHHNTIIHNHYGLSGGYDNYNNTYSENTIINNDIGFGTNMYDDKFFHNNFVNNGINVVASGANAWNNSCEGNYWSDYIGADSDGDGIGDVFYLIDSNNIDHYPLMNRFWNPADINHDLKVNLKDVFTTAKAYGSAPGDSKWNPHCDINADAIIDLKDYYAVCKSFGQSYPDL